MRGIVLFGHGSRDTLWRAPMDAVAARIGAMTAPTATTPPVAVRCAFLELMQPDLATAVGELVLAGARDIDILPMFLGVGRHARDDLPLLVTQVMARFPGAALQLRPAIGEDPGLIEWLARFALETPAQPPC